MSESWQDAVGIQSASAHEFLKTHRIAGRRSEHKVRKLIRQMRRDGWTGGPIVVIEYAGSKYILDGHHRCWAARQAQILVHYRTIDVAELPEFRYDSVDRVVIAHAEAGQNRIRLR